jgi:hypothetical protein
VRSFKWKSFKNNYNNMVNMSTTMENIGPWVLKTQLCIYFPHQFVYGMMKKLLNSWPIYQGLLMWEIWWIIWTMCKNYMVVWQLNMSQWKHSKNLFLKITPTRFNKIHDMTSMFMINPIVLGKIPMTIQLSIPKCQKPECNNCDHVFWFFSN